ncbi:RNA helicase [Phytophthora cinnamomi]|uniref:RNA helicase n=1 Tax=Phytophthora cinnamomi TaxID=4785 RepID=UPI00355A6E46|nr:RNA helicase [Phytophthora cinnamomi]
MGKELTGEQKAAVMKFAARGDADGPVSCCCCDKESTSRNVDRWLRGLIKPAEDAKPQLFPAPVVQEQVVKSNVPTTTTHAALLAPNSNANVFKVHVSKDYMKFNAAHFIAFKGFREKLHGHNYRLAVTITGQIGSDGYVVDFGEVKKISRVICKDLNESFLVPMNSDVLKISFDDANVHILTEDMARFSFPKADCSLLPIAHSSAEELTVYISNQLVEAFTLPALLERGVRKLEVSVSEADNQLASYERAILE